MHLKLSRVLELADLVLGCDLLEDLLAVVGPEGLGGVLAAVLEEDLLSAWVLQDQIWCKSESFRRKMDMSA